MNPNVALLVIAIAILLVAFGLIYDGVDDNLTAGGVGSLLTVLTTIINKLARREAPQ